MATSAAICASLALVAPPATAAIPVDTSGLIDAITADALNQHLTSLQDISDDNGGSRAAGTPGYAASVDYVESTLRRAGYATTRQSFSYDLISYEGSTLARISPDPMAYQLEDDFYPMGFTGNADVQAAVAPVDVNLVGDRASTSGCEAQDFTDFPVGEIALIQRGSCDFRDKALNAQAAGASGVIIFNQGNDVPGEDRFGTLYGTLGSAGVSIPVVGVSFELGAQAAGRATTTVRMRVESAIEKIGTQNLIAESTGGRTDRAVLVGAHLDSVPDGPGINDNGTGTAALLEIAVQLSKLGLQPRNQVRFAFWGGEEDGLYGSDFYVAQLTKAQKKQIAVNLNFDMLGSSNPVTFVYDGDGDTFGSTGPNGSDIVESVFEDYFTAKKLPFEATEFDGRSDYFAFINAGIPAGGLFSGAEGIKTPEQASLFGGTAGEPYDECYHLPCDTIGNVDLDGFETLADAAAHATLTFAETASAVNGTAKGKAKGQIAWKYKGNSALR